MRVRKDGSRFWAHVILDAITDDAGHTIGFAKITRDITRQKEHAGRPQKVSPNLDLALSNMSQGLCLYDEVGHLLLFNPRISVILGSAAQKITVGCSFNTVIHAIGVRFSTD